MNIVDVNKMIAIHSPKSLYRIIFKVKSCDLHNCSRCINFSRKLLPPSCSYTRICHARSLCMNKNEPLKANELHTKESEDFGNLNVPLEKVYKSVNGREFKKIDSMPLNSASLTETDGQNDIFSTQSVLEESCSDIDEESDDDEAVSYEKKPAKQYLLEMKECDKNKDLKGALALYSDMKQNKVFPQKYIYTFLIGACGRAGYTKGAFKLFKQMRDRHMEPSVATLTGLFNSCAETPFPKYGLEKAHHLRNKMIENVWLPSTITYNAMIKAFGRCGDLKTAFQIMDEMADAKHSLTSETFCFLLMSCISDKEAGFTHAVQVFRRMKKLRVPKSTYHYNLLLRATRECGTGPPEIASQLLFDWYLKKPGLLADNNSSLKISSSSDSTDKYLENPVEDRPHKSNISESSDPVEDKLQKINFPEPSDSSLKVLSSSESDPRNQLMSQSTLNLLTTNFLSRNEVIGIEKVLSANDRLLLIGGVDGFLSNMKLEKVKPNIKTITIMLDCIPSTYEAEKLLLDAVAKYNVKPDIDFFNLLIKRRNIRDEHSAALEVLQLLPHYGINVDIATYGVLALGCETRGLAKNLLNDMKMAGIQPNVEIVGALVSNAVIRKDFRYIIDMMNATKELGIKPDSKMLEDLENARRKADSFLSMKDSKKHIKLETLKWCRIFCMQYKPWLQSIDVEIPHHRWKEFKMSN